MHQLLEDSTGIQRAFIRIDKEEEGQVFETIVSDTFTSEQVEAFETYWELVNSFALSLVDQAQERIDSFGFRFRDESHSIEDLLVYWEEKKVTFRRKDERS